jgi:pimeloyl-ACP methyl ester carboxylesterase
MRTRLIVLSLAAIILTPTFTQTQVAIAWEPFTFNTPSGAAIQAERGWLDVPERHLRPGGAKVRLPIVRLRATGTNPGPPIVWLTGGPGEPGTRRLVGSYPLFEALRTYGDVIAFDQRGTGMAEPSLAVPGQFDLPADQSTNSAQARRRLITLAETIRDTIRSRGIDLGAYNTRESADDIETLRQALGIDKVVLVAHSYGTHLALATIKRHGTHVSRAILGGVNGLGDRWREPASGDRWLEQVAASTRKDAAPAALTPDFVAQVGRVLEQLERDPIIVSRPTGNVLIGKSEIQLLVTLRSGDLEFIQGLPAFFSSLEKRTRTEELATLVQQIIRQRPIGTAMTYAMHVASGVSPDLKQTIVSQAPSAIFGNAINWGIGDDAFVQALGVPDLGEAFRAPFQSTVPVLLISASLDGRTAEADARAVGRQFQQAAHITIDGASHDFLFRRPAPGLIDMIGAFLRREVVRDTRIETPVQFRRPE